MAMARIRRACLASAVRAASARNCEILRSWRAISIADMLPAPRINDVLHRVTFAAGWESQGVKFSAIGIRGALCATYRNTQRARLAIALRYVDPPDRRRKVAAGRQTIPKFIEVVLKISLKVRNRLAVYTSSPWLALTFL